MQLSSQPPSRLNDDRKSSRPRLSDHSSSLAFLSLLSFPIPRNALTAFLRNASKAGVSKSSSGVADDRDLLKRAEVGELQPRLVTEHGRFALMKRHQLEPSFEVARRQMCSLGQRIAG